MSLDDKINDNCCKEENKIKRKEIKNSITKTYRLIFNNIKPILEEKYPTIDWKPKPKTPEALVPKYVSELQLGFEVEKKAIEILNKSKSIQKSPHGMAGTAVYMTSIICNNKQTKKDVAIVAKTTEATIRNICPEMLTYIPEISQYFK